MDFHAAIAGAMPKWRRYVHQSSSVFMCLVFGGIGYFNARFLASAAHTVPFRSRLFVTLLLILLAAGGIGLQLWYQRRIISDFRYDGCTLQFRTLGIQEPQMRPLNDISSIRDWRGKGGSLGYRLQFQDSQKLYLEFSVSNSTELVNRVRTDLRS